VRAPNPPAAIVAVAAFFGLVALTRAAIPLIDGDVWWHIRAGRETLDAGTIADRDTWTIVGEGMRWVSQDWLSNVILAAGYGLGELGPTVLSLLFSLLVVGSLALLYVGMRWRDASIGWLSRIVWLAVGLTVAGPVIGVRVQVVDLPLAVAAVVLLWQYLADGRRRWLAGLPLVAVAWANVHAGWVLLFLLGGAVVVGEAVDRLLGRVAGGREPLTWRDNGLLAVALVASAAAIALNPNGPALYLYPLETASIAAHRDFLAEWSPPDVTAITGQLYVGFAVLGVLPALAFGWRRMRGADLLVLVGLTLMAATAARFMLVTGPIGAAIIGVALAPAISDSRLGRSFGPALARLGRRDRRSSLGVVNMVLAGLMIAVGVGATWTRISPNAQEEAIAEHMPVAAVDWIVDSDPGDRPFNKYSWGGYLGLRQPSEPVYIDGRSDIYGDAPIREYAQAINLEVDPQALLDRHEIDYVLFDVGQPFSSWLDESAVWERAYSDDVAAVWVRREE
jgi:hypothetical protein